MKEERYLDDLQKVCRLLAHEYTNVNQDTSDTKRNQKEQIIKQLFDLTDNKCIPPEIAELAESFGLMLIKIEARDMHQEKLIHELQLSNKNLQVASEKISLIQDVTIDSMGNLAEYRDQETGGHIKRTKRYVQCIAEEIVLRGYPQYSLTPDDVELLVKSAPLHDIGKVGVPDGILLKPGKLTQEEFAEMKNHTIYGRDIIIASEKRLGEKSFLSWAREIACSHHEKWDGSGYPDGLKGEEIPLSGRIMAVADVYDALISKRVYKEPLSHEKAVSIIVSDKGKGFDPLIVDIFMDLQFRFRDIAIELADFEEERQILSG